jgi:hypothetical protein
LPADGRENDIPFRGKAGPGKDERGGTDWAGTISKSISPGRGEEENGAADRREREEVVAYLVGILGSKESVALFLRKPYLRSGQQSNQTVVAWICVSQ